MCPPGSVVLNSDPDAYSAFTGWAGDPAGASIIVELQVGRVLRGLPLALAVAARQLLFLVVDDDGLAPSWLVFHDKVTKAKLGRLAVGRDPEYADGVRVLVERDLAVLTREAFLGKWAS